MSELSELLYSPWFPWALFLVIGTPLAVLVLGELLGFLERNDSPFVGAVRLVRNYLLPVLVITVLVRYVVEVPSDELFYRITQTALWVILILVALSVVNALVFGSARSDSWRGRMPTILVDLVRVFLVSFGVLAALTFVWGANIGNFLAALGITSVVLGLILQRPLGNIVAGLVLLAERPFAEGDYVKIGDNYGRVAQINWRALHLETGGNTLVVPNAALADMPFTNLNLPSPQNQVLAPLAFGSAYSPNQVRSLLVDVLAHCPGVLADPPPSILVTSMDRTVVNYQVAFYVDSYHETAIARDAFLTRLWYAGRRANCLPFTDLALPTSVDVRAALDAIAAIFHIDEGGVNRLANCALLVEYAAGETIIHQGTIPPALFIMVAGVAQVLHVDAHRGALIIAALRRNDHFGEPALTGSRSVLDVVAETDVTVLQLDPAAVNDLLDGNPRLAYDLDTISEARKNKLKLMISSRATNPVATADQ
ncbi:MAG: mechanosensitive ion channel [Anaerolineales bacterium]|nr:mechanosensitive ion channel [Anaerolineales bacterium]